VPVPYCVMNRGAACKIVDDRPAVGAMVFRSVGANAVNRPEDVRIVQSLLNQASQIIGVPRGPLDNDGLVGPRTVAAIREFQADQFGFSDGRIDPDKRTINRLNVLTGPTPDTLFPFQPLGAEGTAPTVSPVDAATAATPRAISWVTLARAHLGALLSALNVAGGVILIPSLFDVVNTHFHLDRDPDRLPANLAELNRIFGLILRVLGDPHRFYREGAATLKSPFADAPLGGLQRSSPDDQITFRTRFPECGPNCQAAMIIHECAHFVGGQGPLDQIAHFAKEFPAPEGEAQDLSLHNYINMTADEAMHNAASYAAFAIHAATGQDSRFGANDISQ